MKISLLGTLFGCILLISGCANIKPLLIHAKDYEVVGEDDIRITTKKRTGKRFFIVCKAQTFDELAQTGMLAAYELYEKYRYDLTAVLILPDKELARTGVFYTQVDYAADNKGALGLSGVDKTLFTSGKWLVRSAEQTLSDQELSIAILWHRNQSKFPSKSLYSSSGYDQAALQDYIAKELQINISEVKHPQIALKNYKGVDIKNWMTPQPN